MLIRVETKAGHGAGKPTSKIIEEVADIYGFMSLVMNLNWIEWNMKFINFYNYINFIKKWEFIL